MMAWQLGDARLGEGTLISASSWNQNATSEDLASEPIDALQRLGRVTIDAVRQVRSPEQRAELITYILRIAFVTDSTGVYAPISIRPVEAWCRKQVAAWLGIDPASVRCQAVSSCASAYGEPAAGQPGTVDYEIEMIVPDAAIFDARDRKRGVAMPKVLREPIEITTFGGTRYGAPYVGASWQPMPTPEAAKVSPPEVKPLQRAAPGVRKIDLED